MPRRPEGSIPLIRLIPGRRTPLQRQLVDAIRAAVRDGRLEPESRLPSTRSLAGDLAVSRSTVVAAFEQLVSEGYLVSRPGSGTRVARAVDGLLGDARSTGAVDPITEAPPELRPAPFDPGVPALDEFASGEFARALRRVLRDGHPDDLAVGSPLGDPRLREAVAAHLRTTRGVRCDVHDVLITSGAQEGLSLAFSAIAGPGDVIWMENPGYIGARRALDALGIRAHPIPVDGEGMRVELALAHAPDATAAYVTPSHQFPTGGVLPLPRRLALLDWAERTGGWIIEDDYDSEFRLEGRPLPSLQGLRAGARVLYVGTFSKSLAPGLRLGFVVMPPELRERLTERKVALWGAPPRWTQSALADVMDSGAFARHIRRTRTLYRERRDALVRAVLDVWPDGPPRIRQPTGAMHAVLDLPGLDVDRIVHEAGVRGIRLLPLDFFAIPPEREVGSGVVLGFARWTAPRIQEAVLELANVIGE